MRNYKLEELYAKVEEARVQLAYAEDNLAGYEVRSALVYLEFALDEYKDYLRKVLMEE